VPTLEGTVEMTIPAGTQPNKILRLKNKGIPDLHGRGVGDELVVVVVDIPTKLSKEQRNLLEEYAKISDEVVGTDSNRESFTEKVKKKFIRE